MLMSITHSQAITHPLLMRVQASIGTLPMTGFPIASRFPPCCLLPNSALVGLGLPSVSLWAFRAGSSKVYPIRPVPTRFVRSTVITGRYIVQVLTMCLTIPSIALSGSALPTITLFLHALIANIFRILEHLVAEFPGSR